MKEFLSRMGVPFLERNISTDPQARQEYIDREYDLLPAMEIGGTVIVEYTGFPQLIEALVQEGYL